MEPGVITIDKNVLKMLSKAQTVTNPKFKMTQIDGNRFMFHDTEISLEGKMMIFPDGYEVELTPNILDALTNKDNDLKGLTSSEKSDFINILRTTNSLQSGDRRSKRGKALDNINTLLCGFARRGSGLPHSGLRTPLRAAPMMRESPIATLQSNITPSPSFREEVDSDDDDVYNSFDEQEGEWFHQAQFLSSDPSELVKKLTVLNGLKEAGNDNTMTEFTAIADELLRQNIINKEEHFQLISLS